MNKRWIGILITCMVYTGIVAEDMPFSVNNDYLTVWNGETYEPFFIKGINLGVARPGTYPGEMDATAEQYRQWFGEIREAGFNVIRIYTLHRPQFYDELLAYNTANPQQPIFFFQGVWLNEELQGYTNDLVFMTDTFKAEIRENIDCVHGRRSIGQRFGKAYGEYTSDVSRWNMGYLIGREVYPEEVLTTNQRNPQLTTFRGEVFELYNGSATEVLFASALDFLVSYERNTYNTERPVSISSWPTLDPLHHPTEPNRSEDTASIDMSKLQYVDAPAGFFISYHAYPYYPDFVSASPEYNGTFDKFGPNSYKAYLIDLKKHYEKFPLIIAEFGVPSSWGVAHYSNSGMNHGGFDEHGQGKTNIRLLQTMMDAGTGGGIQFAWIDEWFKNTWITDPIDNGNKTLWHNITAAEQNYGLKKFVSRRDWQQWKTFEPGQAVKKLDVRHNYDFLEFKLELPSNFEILDELWLALDTYDAALGEVRLPNGQSIGHGAEFVVHITRHSARLYVTQAYDLFALWHRETTADQLHQSVATNGAPWNIVRWKNSVGPMDIQYIGDLQVNISVQPPSSKDAVIIDQQLLTIRLPWTLINFSDPSKLLVFHDDKATPAYESRTSDGVAVTIAYKGQLVTTPNRYVWSPWNSVLREEVDEVLKPSYWDMVYNLTSFNSVAVAKPDSYVKDDTKALFKVDSIAGLLQNDFDLDGLELQAVLMEAPSNGYVELNANGSFVYIPQAGFVGTDHFRYAVFDGATVSNAAQVALTVKQPGRRNTTAAEKLFRVYPYPASDSVTLESDIAIAALKVIDFTGRVIRDVKPEANQTVLDVSTLPNGHYLLLLELNGKYFSEKILIRRN